MIFHPSVGIFTSKQLDIAIPMCSRNKTWRAYSAWQIPVRFLSAKVRNVGKELGNLHGNNERWHGSLGQKNGKNHPGINFYRLHCCTKKSQKEGEVFAVYRLGCILLSAYKCEIYLSFSIKLREIRESQDSRLQKIPGNHGISEKTTPMFWV